MCWVSSLWRRSDFDPVRCWQQQRGVSAAGRRFRRRTRHDADRRASSSKSRPWHRWHEVFMYMFFLRRTEDPSGLKSEQSIALVLTLHFKGQVSKDLTFVVDLSLICLFVKFKKTVCTFTCRTDARLLSYQRPTETVVLKSFSGLQTRNQLAKSFVDCLI